MTLLGPCCAPVPLLTKVAEVRVDRRSGQHIGNLPPLGDIPINLRVLMVLKPIHVRSLGSPLPSADHWTASKAYGSGSQPEGHGKLLEVILL